ncbi:bacteriocin immunity protein [Pseudomonas sp. H11T01]|uniref:bacteriocin immunity protein n=1 Tax=Pseudomonas sp. H11T01 TaxID=3402749 RepID=UPI003AC94B8A
MELKSALSDYTEDQFKALIQSIKDCEGTEDFQAELIAHLNSLAAGAGGSDLIYYPEDGADNSAEGVVQTIQAWCLANSLPGFKPRF